jgi:DNA primase
MTASELKEHIYEQDRIIEVLEELECHGISKTNSGFRCGLPNHRNRTSVDIKNSESLQTKVFISDDSVLRGDIVTLTMEIKSLNFYQALKYLHEFLGLSFTNTKPVEVAKAESPLDIFKKAKSRTRVKFDISTVESHGDDILEEYIPLLTLDWIREGIISKTAREFLIGFDSKRQRVVIPHRSYRDGSIVGIMGRTVIENYDILGIQKYLPLLAYPKSLNLYGLAENYDGIQEAGYVSVGEAEKHVLKRHSRLDRTCGSVCSHNLSGEQVSILIGLDVEIVICYDKDVSLKHIRSECEKFYGIRPVSYIYDEFNLLKDKESPSDKHDKIYKLLFNRRVKYDAKEHNEYIKMGSSAS